MLLACALAGWVAMAPGAAARQPTDTTGPTAAVQLPKPPALSPSVLAARALSALPEILARGASASDVTRLTSPAIASKPKDPKIDSHLVDLSAVDESQRAAGGVGIRAANLPALPNDLKSMVTAGLMRIDDSGRVQVYVHSKDDVGTAADAAGRAGGLVQHRDDRDGIVQALVPISGINHLAASSSVKFVRLPDYGVAQAGSVTTEGDSILKANLARADHGMDGTGVRVGVISTGVGGLSSSQASGDLPAVNTTTCNVSGSDPTSTGAEGTAMLEIVHDIAPGAQLSFGHFSTSLEFNAAVSCLAANNDVVVDDIAWLNQGPYDGTSYISMNTTAALNSGSSPIRAYMTSAGNLRLQHYQEPYQGCGGGTDQLFSATSNTVDFAGVGAHCYNPIVVPAGETLSAWLEWNDPWGASCNDYDLYLFDSGLTTTLASSQNPQTCSQIPAEDVHWQNLSSTSVVVDLAINNYNGLAASRTFDLFATTNVLPGPQPNFYTPSSSIPNQADAGGGVVTVGAIDATDPGNDTVYYYSSLGPTNDGRTKPDITGIDGVSVTGDGGFGSPFYGTSAAAPHIAGIAALLLQCKPSLKAGEPGDNPGADRTALRTGLLSHAVDLGAPGTDNVFGAGRADAQASANAVCPATTPTPSPTPSPTPTPTHSPSSTPTPTSTATNWHASNFAWYENVVPGNGGSTCDTGNPVPPNLPNDAGLCVVFDLQIPNASYDYRVLLTRNGVVVADSTFPNVNLYSGPGWNQAFNPPAPGGNYDLKLYANGVLLGESNVTVPGPTPSPTPTAGPSTPTPSPTHTPIPPQTHSPSPTPSATPTPTPTGPIQGDLNCSGGVGLTDVMLGLKIVAGVLSSLPCAASADVDCNGIVNGLDVLDLVRFVVHLPSLVTGNCPAIGSA